VGEEKGRREGDKGGALTVMEISYFSPWRRYSYKCKKLQFIHKLTATDTAAKIVRGPNFFGRSSSPDIGQFWS